MLAANGFLMTALPIAILDGVFAAAAVFCVALDWVKTVLIARLRVA